MAEKAQILKTGEMIYIEAPYDGITDVRSEIRGALHRAGLSFTTINNIFDIRVSDKESVGNKTVWQIKRTSAP